MSADEKEPAATEPSPPPAPEPMRKIMVGKVTGGLLLVQVPDGRLIANVLGDAKSVILSAEERETIRAWLGETHP